jgi:nitrous oxidase accessory protein
MTGLGKILIFIGLFSALAGAANAADILVEPGSSLQGAVEKAEPGDRLRLVGGIREGPVVINKPLTLAGESGAGIAGKGSGTVVTISADNVTVRGLDISGSGSSHEALDSGIKVTKGIRNARVIDNRLTGNLVGIDIHGGIDAIVRGNTVIGRRDHRMNSRGNGIYIWNAPGTVVAMNVIRFGRDGIFVNTSRNNRFEGNRFRDLRFAVHYMYTHSSELIGNRSQGNHVGYALMNSKRLEVRGNVSLDDRDHGIMLNYVNDAHVADNRVVNGREKCLFMYNANKNRIERNEFRGCSIGVHFTAGSERNEMVGNAFVDNRTQVKYVGTRWLEWSDGERGNYWSDHVAFDLDGDARADIPYRPNDLIDHVLWSQPAARLLLGSPAIQLVRWTLSAFPGFLPGGVIDSHPLMRPGQAASGAPS